MNYGVDHIIEKVMADKNTSGEIAVMVLDILRTAAQIEEMYKKPVMAKPEVVEVQKPEIAVKHTRGKYTLNGETKSLRAWADEYGIAHRTLEKYVYDKKMTLEDALKVPYKPRNRVAILEYDRFGKEIRRFDSMSKTSRELQMPIQTIYKALTMSPSDQINEYGYYLMTA